MTLDLATAVALEHVQWCLVRRMSFRRICRQAKCVRQPHSFDEAVEAIAERWLAMVAPKPKAWRVRRPSMQFIPPPERARLMAGRAQ